MAAANNRTNRVAVIVAGAILAGWVQIPIAVAQDAPLKTTPESSSTASKSAISGRAGDSGRPSGSAQAPAIAPRQLPADNTTSHSVDLPGRSLQFKATAGSIALTADDGHVTAELGYIAYQRDGADPVTRPVAFLFNGGPGSASAWVHIGGFGPWRLAVENARMSPSAQPLLVPNAETWLDFTDLVFIDPAGTGFSRVARSTEQGSGAPSSGSGEATRNQGSNRYFYSVNGDAESVADMIAKWLIKHNRIASPKILVGESYGGIRAPKVLHRLQTLNGVGMSALVLISPVMDFGLFRGPRHHLNAYVNSLPTIAAATREANGQPFKSRDELAEVEAYARGDYLLDLMRGPGDAAAVDRLVKRVTSYSGLPETTVRQYGGRLDEFVYIRETNRAAQKQASGYDSTVTADDPDSTAYFPRWDDPISSGLNAPMIGSMISLYSKLGWTTDLTYNLAAGDVLRGWQWGNSTNGVESFTQLQAAMALDPRLRVLVTHGATDLRTPYLGSVLVLEQLQAFATKTPGRVTFRLFPGGHMHYLRGASRKDLRADVKSLVETATADQQKSE